MAVQDINHNIRVSHALRTAFYKQCAKDKANPSDRLRQLMVDYAAGRITYTPKQRGNTP